MVLLTTLYNDILTQIVSYLDSESYVHLSHTCWHLYRFTHGVRPKVLLTNNIYEALRSGSLLSLKNAKQPADIDLSSVRCTNIDMLMYIHDNVKICVQTNIVHQICKMGKLMFTSETYHNPSLIIHAITHKKQDLLEYMHGIYAHITHGRYCAYGYAKLGDYDNFILCGYLSSYDDRLKYYAYIGGNERIMNAVDVYNHCEKLMLNVFDCVGIIKRDDYDLFIRMDVRSLGYSIAELCIRHNALKILKHISSVDGDSILEYIYSMDSNVNNMNMSMEMANLLLEYTHNDKMTVRFIVQSYNYRLTEMLRAGGLYEKKLTIESSHDEFITW